MSYRPSAVSQARPVTPPEPIAEGVFCGRVNHLKGVMLLGCIAILFELAVPPSSMAIPAFARKYDLSCTSCHTKPPRLNAFGEAFHMAGFQIPMTEEGEIRGKRKIGRVFMDTDFLNLFSARASGSFVENTAAGDPSEVNLVFPHEMEVYLAGTITQDISYFFEMEHETRAIEGIADDQFEEKSRFGLGKEFFLMFNAGSLLASLFSMDHQAAGSMPHDMKDRGRPMLMGPMIMVGKIDPSTNFSYPTNRQFILDLPGRLDSTTIKRFGLTPYAFSSKFFGMKTGKGDSVEVSKEVLYNSTGDIGLDIHFMVGRLMFQTGVMQGLKSGPTDVNQKKDPYFMARANFGDENYFSGSISGLVYWGEDTGRVQRDLPPTDTVPVDWLRYGFSGNIKYRLLDVYGAFIWDRISSLPDPTRAIFDDEAFGFTVEGDYLLSDHLLVSMRYDQLNAGGMITLRANAKVVTLQSRYYIRDNFSLYVRDSYNVEGKNRNNPLQSFQNLAAIGVDFDF